MPLRSLILCALILLSAHASFAEEPPPAINCKVSLYLVGDRARGAQAVALEAERKSEKLYYHSEGTIQEVTINSGQRTSEFQYIGPQEFKLYRQTGTNEAGQPTFSPVASYQLPLGIRRTMLTLIDQGRRYALLPIDLSRAQDQKDIALVLNMGSATLACQAGNQRFTLDPLETKQISLKSVQSDLQFEIKCAAQMENQWRLVYSGSQTVRRGIYYVFLLLPEADGSAYRVVRFRV